MRAATGEIVAYIDSDAMADPDWLSYLAATFLESDVGGVGGPNLVPKDDNWLAKCVYRSPGGPTQVMLDDKFAEHIPGCNMAFWKWALEDIDGFDPMFTTAADDVDVCWRLLEKDYRLGFSPSAVVWHRRRSSVKAYWRQQVGYGVSEALLERKHPNKFNPWGHTFWGGRIYAPNPEFRFFGKPVIYHGLWGSAGFQSMYDSGSGHALSFLPRAMEWHVALLALIFISIFIPWALVLVGLGLGYTVFYSFVCANSANINNFIKQEGTTNWIHRLKWRSMIAWFHLLEPLARDWGRLKGGLTPWRIPSVHSKPKRRISRWWAQLQPFRRKIQWSYPGGVYLEKHRLLEQLTKKLNGRWCAVGWNSDFQNWDLKVRRGTFSEAILQMVIEYHGGPNRQARFSAEIRQSKSIYWVQAVLAVFAGAMGLMDFSWTFAILLASIAVLWVAPIIEANRLEDVIRFAADEVTSELKDERSEENEFGMTA